MKNRHWMLPACLTTVFILFLAAGLVFALRSRAEELPGTRIPVNHEVTLRHVTTLTGAQTKYTSGERSWSDALIMRLPPGLRVRLLPHWQPAMPLEVQFSSMDPGDFRLIMRVEYPKSWLGTSRSDTIIDSIDKALDNSGMKYVRIKYGKGSYTRPDSLQVHHGQTLYDASGRVVDAKPYASISVNDVPMLAEDLELQFLSAWDDKATITRTLKLTNPCYKQIDPLPEPPPLPQTETHDDIEVTLRALVSKIPDNIYIDFQTSGSEEVATIRTAGLSLPVSQSILPPEFFPRAEGTASQPFRSAAVFDVHQRGVSDSEWGLSDIDVYYGTQGQEWGISSWSMHGRDSMRFISFPGDLGLISQPLKVVATLNRISNFPADEKQTVEVPLPEVGQVVRPGTTIKLWDGSLTVGLVSYKTKVEFVRPFTTEPDMLSVGLTNVGRYSDVREAYLVKSDGTTISLNNRRSSSSSTDKVAILNYDIEGNVSYGSQYTPPDYDDCTTLGLTVIRPRDYPHKFEFTARPIEATGKYDPNK